MNPAHPIGRVARSLGLCAALSLAACGQDGPPPEPPLPPAALEAVGTEPGVPRERLARAIEALFTSGSAGHTHALVLMHRGEIVAERYGEDVDEQTRFIGWSVSKTVTAILVGMLVADGRLRLDDPAPIENWQRAGDPRRGITLRHLLQMRSGLRNVEAGERPYEGDEVRMLFLDGRTDMAGWAEAQPLAAEPGTTFAYSSASTLILSDIATDTIERADDPDRRREAMADFLQERLAVPLGMDSLTGEYDAAGTLIGASHIWATARDWAKLGEFLRHGGSVRGAQIVPRGWIDFMRTASPASPDYGGQLWLNRPSGTDRDVLFADDGPDSAFAAIGHLGQYVIVSPEQGLTLVRFGTTQDEDRAALIQALGNIVALYPGR